METQDILFAFLLTFIAGISTGIGSLLAFFTTKTNTKFLSVALGFSAGVMIFISMIELYQGSLDYFNSANGENSGKWLTIVFFFGGMFIIALIDKLIPNFENPHEIRMVEDMSEKNNSVDTSKNFKKLKRVGLVTALAITIHNVPEGLATFITALQEPTTGIAIAIAIAIHNIPEGIAVAVPIYYSTGSRKKAFFWSLLSGLSEMVGAILGFIILMPFLSAGLFGALYAIVAGIMVYISFDTLLPAAREYGENHLAVYGLILGMIVMAVSLNLLM
ncbi:MAG: zinc transporter ZupT [Bacteroidales bacterium]|nr:zinc transporter ZupT [Bacteroidales bacterium]